MADSRRGLNCTLSYVRGGATRTFKCRVDTIGHGVMMVADESSGRSQRAYYPHRIAPSRFYLRVLLKGRAERKAFADWIQAYASYVMNPGLAAGDRFPDMRVLVPARGFDREGVPLSGMEWGNAVGAMTWEPTIIFETTREPQDTATYEVSSFVGAEDPDMKYFWPMGTQLGGSAVPSGNYAQIIDGSDGGSDAGQSYDDISVTPRPNEGTLPSEGRYDYGD